MKKISSLLFNRISFKFVLLLASESEFNCFLRGRCSMEMWCPDDIGRAQLGLGWAACLGREHPSTLQSGVEAPRLLKRSPPQIVLLLLFLLNGFYLLKE